MREEGAIQQKLQFYEGNVGEATSCRQDTESPFRRTEERTSCAEVTLN